VFIKNERASKKVIENGVQVHFRNHHYSVIVSLMVFWYQKESGRHS
jgi:predicted metal-dependent hydrolase